MKTWHKVLIGVFAFIVIRAALCGPKGTETKSAEKSLPTVNKDSIEAAKRAALIAELPDLIRDFDAAKFSGKPADVAVGALALELRRTRLQMAKADKHPDAAKWAASLKAVQAKAYPELRRAWAKAARNVMWENNIEVEAQGKTATTVLFTGGAFANNKNIATIQESVSEQVRQLRFKKVKYKWYEGDDEYQYYDLETPADTDVE